jgi:hypothetical protein
MTLAEFKYLAANRNAGLSTLGNYVATTYWPSGYVLPAVGGSEIIILFNTYAGGIIKVDAIGIKILDYTLEQLEQVVSIDVDIPKLGGVVNVPVNDSDVPYRRVEKTVNGPYFIYAITPEEQRQVIIQPTTGSSGYEEYTSKAVLEYAKTSLIRQSSDYDTELPINRARESMYIYKCDRVNPTPFSKTNPVNLPNILNNAAPLANIQDSNYTSTPWINARYEGSRLDTNSNKGTDPLLQGAFFQGAFFTKDVTDVYIENLVDKGNITYVDYFAVGKLTTPGYAVEPLNLSISTLTSYSSSIIETVTSYMPASNKDIAIGDLLQLSTGNGGNFSSEVLRVTTPNPPALYSPYEFLIRSTLSGETSKINTIRNYTNTSRSDYTAGSNVYRIVPVQILQLDKAKTTPVQEGRIKVKGADGILSVSRDGYIVSGSTRTFI